jgi:hypothetical protein
MSDPQQAWAVRELERVVRYAQAQKGLIPEWAPRPLLPHELRATVNFAALDRIMRVAYAQTEQALTDLRDIIVADLRRAIGTTRDPKVIAARISQWAAAGSSPSVTRAKANAARICHAALVECANQSGRQLQAEATAQGVRMAAGDGLEPEPPPIDPLLIEPGTLFDEALLPVLAVETLMTDSAISVSQRPTTPDVPTSALEKASILKAFDLARQGVHIAQGEGRTAAAGGLPPPENIYASELLDQNTCGPCSAVDGRSYPNQVEAERDYPNSGPYAHCLGGSRCRGTLVWVWPEH